MGLFSDLLAEFAEPLNELKTIAQDAVSEFTDTKSEVTDGINSIKENASEKVKNISDIVKK